MPVGFHHVNSKFNEISAFIQGGLAVKMIHALLFNQKEKFKTEKQQKKLDEKFEEIGGDIRIGDKVKMKQNRQVGIVKEIRGKKALLQVGIMPMTVALKDLVVVVDKVIP